MRNSPLAGGIPRVALTALALSLTALAALADGRIHFTVYDSETKKPIPGAVIVLDPAETELSGVQYTTADTGKADTGDLAAGVRAFRARATVEGVVYKELKGRVTVLDNQDIEIDLELDRQGVIERQIKEDLQRLDTKTTSNYTFRDRKQLAFYPLAVGNGLSLEKQLLSVPGLSKDSVRRLHPRGEAGGPVYSIDGFLLPPTVAGRSIAYIDPSSLETLRTHVGGFSAWQGTGSGAFLEAKLRPAIPVNDETPLSAMRDWRVSVMGYSTTENAISLARVEPKGKKTLGYYVQLGRRVTDNALESPQPDVQNSVNDGQELSLSGKVELKESEKTTDAAFFTIHDGRTGISNRTGLDAQYFGVGQGYGYGGRGNESDFPATPAEGANFRSQRVLGNQVYQNDAHRFVAFQRKTELGEGTKGVFTLGFASTGSKTSNFNARTFTNMNALPQDWSVEFLPTTRTRFDYVQAQGDVTSVKKSGHNLRYGFLAREQSGSESYKLAPQSQNAVNALRNIDPTLGAALTNFGAGGTTIPTLRIDRSGSYQSVYAEDTYGLKNGIRVNGGLRLDNYNQSHTLDLIARTGKTTFSAVSPRLNLLYEIPNQNAVVRTSIGQIVTLPGTGQGAIATNPVKPQTTDQLDLSVEKQLGNQLVKLSLYNKSNKDTIAYKQLVTGPQQMAFATMNAGKSKGKGWEMAYEYNPREFNPAPGALREPQGLSGFLGIAGNQTRFQQAGGEVVAPQDQGTTVTGGVGYRFVNGFSSALSVYRGSGFATSALRGVRSPISEVNFRLASPVNYFYDRYGLEFGVENLFNSQGRYSLNDDFAGTRFQQGRRLTVSLFGRY